MPSTKVKHTIFYGWWVLISCMIIQFYTSGTYYQGFTAFFDPLVSEFGWSHAAIALAFSFRGFESGLIGPIVGILVDRLGPRKLLISGVLIMALGFWLFRLINTLWSYYAVLLFISLGFSCVGPVVCMTAIVKWFKTRQGLALGILTASLGGAGLLVPAVVWTIDSFSWREAVVIFAIGTGVLCIPPALVVKNPPEEKITPLKIESTSNKEPKQPSFTPGKVFKKKEFWLLSMAIMFGWVAGAAVVVYLIPALVFIGISRQTAGFLTVIFYGANVVGRLLFGWLGDILDKRYCFVIAVVIKAIGVLGFGVSSTVGQVAPALITLGIGYGGLVPLRPGLQQEFFGKNSFGTIQGFLMIFVTLGGIVSPVMVGWMFDISNTYRLAFIFLAAATLIAVPMVLATHRRQPSDQATR